MTTCIVCYRPSDTALAVIGEPDWHQVFLEVLGLPDDEAKAVVASVTGWQQTYVVCAACASKSPFPAPVRAVQDASIPVVAQPAAQA